MLRRVVHAVLKYAAMRIFWMLVGLFVVTAVVYLVCSFVMLNVWSPYTSFREDAVEALDSLNNYIQGILFRWDWGVTHAHEPVWEVLVERMPITLQVIGVSFFLYIFGGILLGLLSAFHAHRWIDKLISILTMIFSALPGFVLIKAFIYIFGFYLDWLPRWYPHGGEPWERAVALILPVLAISGPL